jgi:hypothetical protein
VNGDTSSVIAGTPDCTTTATPTSPPGTYPIDCTLGTLSATNYVFDLTASATLTVTTAMLTVTTDPATKVYGAADPTFSATITGFQNGDTIADLGGSLSFATTAGPTTGVGTYAVTPSGLTSANYAINFVAGTLTIGKATLTVTPQNAAVAPGDPIPTTWVTDFTGFVAGDDTGDISGAASCATDAVFGDPPADYTITCTVGTLTAANYDFVIGGTAIFTIGTVTLHVTVDDSTKPYGDPNPTFTVTYVGFVSGDDESSLGGTLAFSTAATIGSPFGTYPVSASGLTSATYLFDYNDGTLTVSQASQTITFGALSGATYGDGPFDLTASSTSGLTVTFTASGSCSVSGITVTITGAGTCTITAHQAGNANYAAAPDVPRAFAVAKATPGISWADPADITYGTALSGVQLDATASVAGSYVYTPASGTVLSAGAHTLSVTFTPTDSVNYAPITTTVDIDVLAKASQTITFPPLDDVSTDHDPITLAATATSGLPITYTVTGPCSVVGTVLTITGTGTCAVTAHQDGNGTYAPASSVTVSFDVSLPLESSISTDLEVVSPNGSVVVTATGFMPGSEVRVWIQPDGDPLTVIADANGDIVVTIRVPAGTEDGPLTIEALGIDPNAAVLDLTTTITILAPPLAPATDTATPEWPLDSLALIVLGVLLLAVAAVVVATTADPTDRRRGR